MDDEFKKKVLKLYSEYDSLLGPYIRKDGRKHIVLNNSKLSKNIAGKLKTISFPKAMIESIHGRKLKDTETCDHIDGDKTNDDPSNLQILSRVENAKKGWKDGNCRAPVVPPGNRVGFKGIVNPNNKLSEKNVVEIRRLGNIFDENKRKFLYTNQQIADMFDCSRETVSAILNNKCWNWLEDK